MRTELYRVVVDRTMPVSYDPISCNDKILEFIDLFHRAQTLFEEYQQKLSIYDTLEKCGYSEDLYQLIGAESFTTSIHLTKRELQGKNHRELKDAFLANIGVWIKTKFKELVKMICDLIKRVLDYIYNLFMNWKNEKSAKAAMTLTTISKIPDTLECTNVFDREPFMTAMDRIRKLAGYLNSWYVNLSGAYTGLIEIGKDKNFKTTHHILPLTTRNLEAAVKTFISETSAHYYSESGYSPNAAGGSFIMPNSNTEYPVRPYDLGWINGSMFRAASNQLNGTMESLKPIITTLTDLKNDVSLLVQVLNNGKSYFSDTDTQNIFTEDTNGLFNITMYVLRCSAVIMQGMEAYQLLFSTMQESIFVALTKYNSDKK